MLKTWRQGAAIAFMAFLWAAPAVPARDAGFPIAPTVVVDGKTIAHAIQIDDGTTYVPLRVVTQALGARVNFDRAKHKITLTPPQPKLLAIPPQPVPPTQAPPAPLVTPQEALKGIGAVFVAPAEISADTETTSLLGEQSVTVEQMRADTVTHLQDAGVPFVNAAPSDPGAPELITEITTVRSSSRLLTSYYVHIYVREATRLQRDDSIAENGITWQTGMIGYTVDANIDALRDSIQTRVQDFINDYLAANPKQATDTTNPTGMK